MLLVLIAEQNLIAKKKVSILWNKKQIKDLSDLWRTDG